MARKGYFDLKERLSILYYHENICKSYSYCYILDLIDYSFQTLVFISINLKVLLNFWYCFFAMPVCAFNSLPKGKYLNIFIVAAFSSKSFSGKTSLQVRNSYLLTFPDDKAKILAGISKSYWALLCSVLL